MYVYMYIYIYIHICTYIYVYIHIYMYTKRARSIKMSCTSTIQKTLREKLCSVWKKVCCFDLFGCSTQCVRPYFFKSTFPLIFSLWYSFFLLVRGVLLEMRGCGGGCWCVRVRPLWCLCFVCLILSSVWFEWSSSACFRLRTTLFARRQFGSCGLCFVCVLVSCVFFERNGVFFPSTDYTGCLCVGVFAWRVRSLFRVCPCFLCFIGVYWCLFGSRSTWGGEVGGWGRVPCSRI